MPTLAAQPALRIAPVTAAYRDANAAAAALIDAERDRLALMRGMGPGPLPRSAQDSRVAFGIALARLAEYDEAAADELQANTIARIRELMGRFGFGGLGGGGAPAPRHVLSLSGRAGA
jgi:hypothetical protein